MNHDELRSAGFYECPVCHETYDELKEHMAAAHGSWTPEPIPVDG